MTNHDGVTLDPWQLRRLRFAKRKTQAEVAAAVECSTSHYRALESDRAKASLPLVGRLENFYETRLT